MSKRNQMVLWIFSLPFVISAAIEFLPFWLTIPVVLLGMMQWLSACITLAKLDNEEEWFDDKAKAFEAFAKLVAAKEREACAKLCDGLADMHEKMNQWGSHITADTLAQAIRARGQA
jgi:CRISPR/Cas system-associated protein Csm6